jgi:hypothetical protein
VFSIEFILKGFRKDTFFLVIFTLFKKNNLVVWKIYCNFVVKCLIMEKTNYIKPDCTDVNVVSEPEMAYTYTNQNDYETILVGKFDEVTSRPQKILQPDDDLRNAISGEEFKKIAREIVRKVHYEFYGNERQVYPGNA